MVAPGPPPAPLMVGSPHNLDGRSNQAEHQASTPTGTATGDSAADRSVDQETSLRKRRELDGAADPVTTKRPRQSEPSENGAKDSQPIIQRRREQVDIISHHWGDDPTTWPVYKFAPTSSARSTKPGDSKEPPPKWGLPLLRLIAQLSGMKIEQNATRETLQRTIDARKKRDGGDDHMTSIDIENTIKSLSTTNDVPAEPEVREEAAEEQSTGPNEAGPASRARSLPVDGPLPMTSSTSATLAEIDDDHSSMRSPPVEHAARNAWKTVFGEMRQPQDEGLFKKLFLPLFEYQRGVEDIRKDEANLAHRKAENERKGGYLMTLSDKGKGRADA